MKKSRSHNKNNGKNDTKNNHQTNNNSFFGKLNVNRILICWVLAHLTLAALVIFNLIVRMITKKKEKKRKRICFI